MPDSPDDPLISVILPVFNEQATVPRLLQLLGESLARCGLRSEIIVIDDGSTDATWALLFAATPPPNAVLKLIRFTRNFGKEAAIMAGIEECTGNAAVVLDADLQHPPDMLQQMIALWRGGEVDVIDAVKTDDRNAPNMDRLTSAWFNGVFRRFTGYELRGASDYKLLDRKVIDALKAMRDYNLFFRGTTAWLGFRHRELGFPLGPRAAGGSKWNLLSRLQLAITAITSFTSLPLHLMTMVGLVSAGFALLHATHTLYNKFSGQAVEGFTTVILLLLIFGSTITLGLGIIGAYLSKIHDEVRGRPRYLIANSITRKPGDPPQEAGR
ncbi:MAG: glycosyltransferase family 2 protein [Halioglobus sp.]|nr:glycosyltransferase family 2 protein [Halioglobus sp.]